MKANNKITINFDLDGCLVGLYDVDNWLEMLIAEDTTPYVEAEPLLRLCSLARVLNRLQRNGYELTVISWLSKNSNEDYDKQVTASKINWLIDNFPFVKWDKIAIIPYGIDKSFFLEDSNDIIFDDSPIVRKKWKGQAYNEKRIFEILEKLLDN